jgi:hypothetical protein
VAPKLGDRPVVIIEQRGTTKAAFDAVDKTIDSMAKLELVSRVGSDMLKQIVSLIQEE